jgi:peptidoglycan/LPS O-acetylase OafA/YrhL
VNLPARLHTLDVLRGVAALAVVLFHWQNFLHTGEVEASPYGGKDQPGYALFGLLYQSGYLAVDLFFSLSGFVFFWLYTKKVQDGSIGARTFIAYRASRLLPLHLLTLGAAALGQALFWHQHGRYMAYWHNDWYHFLLQLPLLGSIGLEQGLGFNGPAWSISVEAVLYLGFFCLCRWGLAHPGVLLLLSVAGFWLASHVYAPIGRGVGSFFVGGLVFQLFQWCSRRQSLHAIAQAVALAALLLWTAVFAGHAVGLELNQLPLLWRLEGRLATLVLFPLSILALALVQQCRPGLGRRFSWLGDISYASYLWHFPLQLAFALLATAVGLPLAVFKSGLVMLLFFSCLLPLAWLSYRYLEMPAQQWLRRRWSTAGGRAAVAQS